MKTIEKEIWDYIDGYGSEAEQQATALKIAEDASYKQCFQELNALNAMMALDDLEEPSMSFNRNVMDAVAIEIAPKALKTKLNNRIIMCISAFFMLSLSSILVYAFANTDLSELNMPQYTLDFKLSNYFTPMFLKIFLFFDVMLALVYFDRLLRSKNAL